MLLLIVILPDFEKECKFLRINRLLIKPQMKLESGDGTSRRKYLA